MHYSLSGIIVIRPLRPTPRNSENKTTIKDHITLKGFEGYDDDKIATLID